MVAMRAGTAALHYARKLQLNIPAHLDEQFGRRPLG